MFFNSNHDFLNRGKSFLRDYRFYKRQAKDTFLNVKDTYGQFREGVLWLNDRLLQRTGIPFIDETFDAIRRDPLYPNILREIDSFYFRLDDLGNVATDVDVQVENVAKILGIEVPPIDTEIIKTPIYEEATKLPRAPIPQTEKLIPEEIKVDDQGNIIPAPSETTTKTPSLIAPTPPRFDPVRTPIVSEPLPSRPFNPSIPKGSQDPRVSIPQQQPSQQSPLGNYFGLEVEHGDPSFLQRLLLPLTVYDPLTLKPTNVRLSNQSILKGVYNVGATIGRFL